MIRSVRPGFYSLIFTAAIMSFTSVHAQQPLGDILPLHKTLQVHGFITQSFLLTSENNFFGNSKDNGTFDFRELGLNASLRPLPELLLSTQVLYRDAGASGNDNLQLDYAFADYELSSDLEYRLGIRIGRVLNPLGFYNETRDVAFTRSGILLPQSIYFDRTRDLALSADGGEFYAERNTDFGIFQLQFTAAVPRADTASVERALLGQDFPGTLDGDPSYLGRILYEDGGSKLRLALSGARVGINYQPNTLDSLKAGSIDFEPVILSAQYNAERWSLTGEYAQRSFAFKDLLPRDQEITGESYYLQGSYRFTNHWEGFIRYDALYTDRKDRNGAEFAATTGRPAFTRFARDTTLGLRWDVTPNLMLRAEFHRVNGTAWLTVEDNPSLAALDQHWDLFALLASYRF